MNNTRKTITKVIKELGISANLLGYYYIRQAVELVISDMTVIKEVTKSIYPAVAKAFETTPSKVERAMRKAIEEGWLKANEDFMVEVFGYSVSADKGKPTNSEFIATVADYISLIEEER